MDNKTLQKTTTEQSIIKRLLDTDENDTVAMKQRLDEDISPREKCNFIVTELQNDYLGNQKTEEGDSKDAFKHRLYHTACICGSMFAMAWIYGMLGPAFPDILLIMKTSLGTGSWVFTGLSLGDMIGCLFTGIAYDRVNKIGFMVFVTLGVGICAAVVPWCANFVAMLFAHVVIGVFGGVLKTASTADIATVWREESRSYLQLLHGTACIGSIISPLVADPFLARKQHLDPERHSTLGNSSFAAQNESFANAKCINNVSINQNASGHNSYGESKLYIPYSISTGICLIVAVAYAVVLATLGNVYSKAIPKVQNSDRDKTKTYFLDTISKNILTALLVLSVLLYLMCERGFTQFLMTFVLNALDWSKTDGSTATGIFWAAIVGGRLASILFVNRIQTSVMLVICLFIQSLATAVFWIACVYKIRYLVFISTVVAGIGMSVILGSLFSLLGEKVRPLTGKVSSLIFVCNSGGGMVFPLLLGYLMESVSPMCFVYYEAVLCSALVFCVITILFSCQYFKRQKDKKSFENNEVSSDE